MKKQWNIIKNIKFLNTSVFIEAETFGEIEEEMKWRDPEFCFRKKDMMLSTEDVDGETKIIVSHQGEDETFEYYLATRKLYNSVQDMIMNHVFEDGTSFIDFMMEPSSLHERPRLK